MTGIDLSQHPLTDTLAHSFAGLIEGGTVDLVPDPEIDAIEIQADEWTLHIEGWPVQQAFVALDEDPPNDTERLRALNATLGSEVLAALRDADQRLERMVSTALAGSNDPLSANLATLLQGNSSNLE